MVDRGADDPDGRLLVVRKADVIAAEADRRHLDAGLASFRRGTRAPAGSSMSASPGAPGRGFFGGPAAAEEVTVTATARPAPRFRNSRRPSESFLALGPNWARARGAPSLKPAGGGDGIGRGRRRRRNGSTSALRVEQPDANADRRDAGPLGRREGEVALVGRSTSCARRKSSPKRTGAYMVAKRPMTRPGSRRFLAYQNRIAVMIMVKSSFVEAEIMSMRKQRSVRIPHAEEEAVLSPGWSCA